MSTPAAASGSSSSRQNPFEKGAKVEVSFDDEGLRGSWYTATVLRAPPKRPTTKSRISVEYDTLKQAEHGKGADKPLRELVPYINVRPIPPREPRRSFRIDEDVDAYHEEGWWEGIVIAAVEDRRYSVYFRRSQEMIDFPESELRLHREWVHEEWVPPLEVDAAMEDQPPPPPPEEGRAPDAAT